MNHDRLCGWSNRPGEWEALAASVPDPPTECSTCADIARVRADERARIRQAVEAALYREDCSLHSIGSSIEAGSQVEFCCGCESDQRSARAILSIIDGEESVRPT